MSAHNRRSRSETTASQRPLSRESTASVPSRSAQTQLPVEQVHHNHQYSTDFLPPQQHNTHSFDATAVLLQSALQNVQQGAQPNVPQHAMEAFHGLPQNADAQSQVQAHQQQQHSSQPAYYAAPNMQFAQSQGMDYQMSNTSSQPGHIAPAGSLDATDRSKRVSNSTATNDKELRDLLRQNDHRSLKDVASEVMATNTTAKAEKSKQLFAMLWLRALCRTAKTSVPRSRVYSTYAEHCGDERVQPLNPASFGKLVRVIFPGIQTRRLGVRGESKYHYVDLALLRDPQEGEGRRRRDTVSSINHAHKPSIDFNSIPPLNADTSVIPTEEQSFPSPTFAPSASASASLDGCVFADPMAVGFHPAGIQTSVTYPQPLLFQPAEPPSQDNDVIQLPDIHSYAPPKTDADAADALSALYRTHCTSLVDCVRFCKEKQFFRLFTSFQGTLTVPVQKLLVHPDIAPWIRECDWLMYQKMIHYVSQLTLQVIPPVAMRFLDTISDNLHGHITKTFHGLPRHVLESKLEPATLFSSLIKRMLKVNQTAHAAARVLIQDECRDQMWRDWVTKVNPKRIMECIVPNCGYEEVYRILTHDVRSILQPLSPELWGIEQGTHYEAAASVPASGATADTVVERIGAFLDSLASRFSHTNARTLINTITALGTAALRDITVEGGHSYNAWWITKVFVDELSIWLASLGGFLEHRPGQAVPQSLTPISNTGTQFPNGEEAGSGEGSRQQSRYSSIDYQPVLAPNTGPSQPEAVSNSQQPSFHEAQPGSQPHFSQLGMDASFHSASRPDSSHDLHDDSGIGLGLLDQSFSDVKPQHVDQISQFANQFPPHGTALLPRSL